VRGIGENDFSVQAGTRHVFAEYIKYRVRVSCGFDLGDIQCPQLLHVFQHPTELGLEFSGFFVGEFDAGQSGYIADPVFNVFREDVPHPGLDRKVVLANAPHSANNLVVVTKVIE